MIVSFHLSLELATQFSHHIRYCRDSFWGAFVVVVWALGRMGREKKERFSSLFSPIPSRRSLRRGSASFNLQRIITEIESGLWMRWNVAIRACPDFSCFLWCVFCNFVCLFVFSFLLLCFCLLNLTWNWMVRQIYLFRRYLTYFGKFWNLFFLSLSFYIRSTQLLWPSPRQVNITSSFTTRSEITNVLLRKWSYI